MSHNRCYLVDASVYIFRAYFSLPSSMRDSKGNPINALYGFCRFVIDLIRKTEPEHIGIAFDESLNTSFRNEIYPPYKANRDEPPDELVAQLQRCREFCTLAGIPAFASPVYEADDIIGALINMTHQQGYSNTVVSRDKDLMQLLRDGDEMWDYASNKRIAYEQVIDHLGVRAEQVADFLALTGDSVDNIPGVPGIGKKTAAAILGAFTDVDDIRSGLERLADLPIRGSKKLAEKITQNQDTLDLALRLTRIPSQINRTFQMTDLERQKPELDQIKGFVTDLGIGGQTVMEIAKW